MLDAEQAHGLTIAGLKLLPNAAPFHRAPPQLATRIAGLDFPSPIGLAAGFAKNAEVPDALLPAGFGFVEVGTLTPRPQEGSSRPRPSRLEEEEEATKPQVFNKNGQ